MISWKKISIGEFADFNPPERIQKGKFYKKVPMAMLTEFERKIKGFEYSEYQAGPKFRNGDTLVAKITPCLENGKTALVDILEEGEIAFGSSEFIVLRENCNSVSDYIFYLAKSSVFRDRAISCMEGTSGRKRVNEGALKRQEIRVPDKITQQQIAYVLSRFDNKIELNNKIKSHLEAMAKMLYDYWFVQFDFPDKKGRPYKSSGGKMVWHEKLEREIPEGWSSGTLNNLGEIVGGSTPPRDIKSNFSTKGIPWITPKDLSLNVNSKFVSKGGIDISDIGFKAASLKTIPQGSILVSSRAPIGYMAITRNAVTTNQGFKSFILKPGYSTQYAFYAIKNALPEIISNASGSTFKEVSGSVLKTIKIHLPDKDVLKSYTLYVEAIFERQNLLELENENLAGLRDWLLPMLMNGQVSVGEISEQKEEKLCMVAESETEYNKGFKLNIAKNEAGFAKQVLAGKIVSLFKQDKNFTHIKFQKLQFLAEHIAEADLNLNYYFQSAGPYDNRFMHSIATSFRKAKWFNEKNYRFLPLEKEKEIDRYYMGYFTPVSSQLNDLFKLLAKATVAETEIISTVYAVWNNRLLLKQPVVEQLIINDFYNWSDRKHQYSKKQILDATQWLNKNGFAPRGFGKEIKRAKTNNK